MIEEPEPPFAILHIFGPGGVGKTTLLDTYRRLAIETGIFVAPIDGRAIDPSPPGFLTALRMTLRVEEGAEVVEALERHGRTLLLIDTYEQLAPLDAWLRETFLPDLPADIVVVIAGRNPPPAAWRADSAWADLARVISLRNLRPEESRAYLANRLVPTERHQTILELTHGHPLALSLVADMLEQSGETVDLTREPNIVRALLERFVQQTPSPLHQQALEICAHARVTTEPMLAEALGVDDARDFFEWLRNLSFIAPGPHGLYPHDLARDVLDADLRWRNPDAYHQMHTRVQQRIVRRIRETSGREQQLAFFDLLYMHRNSPIMRPAHDWEALGAVYAEPATASDYTAVLEMVERHEGRESARIAAHWLDRQPGAFVAFRGTRGDLIGFSAHLGLHAATADDLAADPATLAAWRFVERRGRPRSGEEVLYHRFVMGSETYQDASPSMNLMAMTCTVQWLTNVRLAWSILAVSNPDFWHPMFTYLNLRRSPEADFAVGEHRYAIYTHDWRAEPAMVWIEVMRERELATDINVAEIESQQAPALVVLSQPEFEEAVRRALRDFTRPSALVGNPLLRSRLVMEHSGGAPVEALRTIVREAVEHLRDHPRDEKLYRALRRTYLEPAATQELAAEALGLPFSTYRYHLAGGVSRVTEQLWRREIYGHQE